VNYIPVCSVIFLKKIGSGTHSGPKFGQIWGGVILIPGKKVMEHRSGLHPFKKELPEQHSITKIPLPVW
jgi:hypothetical protein